MSEYTTGVKSPCISLPDNISNSVLNIRKPPSQSGSHNTL